MKQIGTELIALMPYDYMKYEPFALKAIPGFNINSVNYEMSGPVFDYDFGVLYTFNLIDCLSLEYNPAIWKTL